MQQTTAGFTAAIHTGRGIVTGGLLIAGVVFLVVALFFVLFYARSLGDRRRQPRAECDRIGLDKSEVIGSFPPRQVSDLTGIVQAVSKSGTTIGRPSSS